MKKRETWCFEGQNTPENPIIQSQGRLHHSKVDIKRESKGEEAGSPDKYFCPARPNSSPQLRLLVLWQGQKRRRRESTIDHRLWRSIANSGLHSATLTSASVRPLTNKRDSIWLCIHGDICLLRPPRCLLKIYPQVFRQNCSASRCSFTLFSSHSLKRID